MLIQIGEAGRVLSDAQLAPDPLLAAEGWERRFTADPVRAKEASDLYVQLGYEVRAERTSAAGRRDECGECYAVASEFMTIYTRRKSQ